MFATSATTTSDGARGVAHFTSHLLDLGRQPFVLTLRITRTKYCPCALVVVRRDETCIKIKHERNEALVALLSLLPTISTPPMLRHTCGVQSTRRISSTCPDTQKENYGGR
eukprot:scaffold262494_cov26-Tisochrysis_lutea.AAC.1